MKNTILFLSLIFILSCQSTYETKDLYGQWKNDTWQFVFNEDKTCKVGNKSGFLEGNWTYNTFGNTLELARNGTVFLSNLTVKGIENDQLTLEFRSLFDGDDKMEKIQVLKRVK